MGLLGKGKDKREVSVSIEMRASFEMGTDDTVQRLLKEATQLKNSGNLDRAIETLRAAYKALDEQSSFFPIQVYLRLPLYLHEAGRKDAAWEEFNRLVLWVNSKPRYSPEATPMELSAIWDKMRLSLQREGKNEDAVRFAVWAYLSWAVGLCVQKRHDELAAYKEEANIGKAIRAALRKADKEWLTDRIAAIILHGLSDLPVVDYKAIAQAVLEELKTSEEQ